MLKIFFGKAYGVEMNPDSWFRLYFRDIINKEFTQKVLREVDRCKILGENLVVSDVLGPIPPEYVSTGAKAVLMMMYSDYLVGSQKMGDNLIPYVREVADKKDVVLLGKTFFNVFNNTRFEPYYGKVEILNDGRIVTNGSELIDAYMEFIPEEGNYETYQDYKDFQRKDRV